jgi:hypothetical protein
VIPRKTRSSCRDNAGCDAAAKVRGMTVALGARFDPAAAALLAIARDRGWDVGFEHEHQVHVGPRRGSWLRLERELDYNTKAPSGYIELTLTMGGNALLTDAERLARHIAGKLLEIVCRLRHIPIASVRMD